LQDAILHSRQPQNAVVYTCWECAAVRAAAALPNVRFCCCARQAYNKLNNLHQYGYQIWNRAPRRGSCGLRLTRSHRSAPMMAPWPDEGEYGLTMESKIHTMPVVSNARSPQRRVAVQDPWCWCGTQLAHRFIGTHSPTRVVGPKNNLGTIAVSDQKPMANDTPD
jgi:hypothetical protein